MDTKEEFLDAPVCFNVDWIEAQDLREETPSLSVSRGEVGGRSLPSLLENSLPTLHWKGLSN